jgi:uncharacterized protein (DUF608 family)
MMGDTTPIFVLSILQLYQVTGDVQVLGSFHDAVIAAVEWHAVRAAPLGLPNNLWSSYDWFEMEKQNLTAYNSVLHLAMLAAAEKIGQELGDAVLIDTARSLRANASRTILSQLWNGRFLRAFANAGGKQIDALHVDSLYGLLWARRLLRVRDRVYASVHATSRTRARVRARERCRFFSLS